MILSGCATLSKEECQIGNWYDYGYQDGRDGKTMKAFSAYQKSYSKHGIYPNINSYRKGRDVGLKEYCQLEEAYQLGLSGKKYNNVCTGEISHKFVKEHRRGYKIFTLKKQLKGIEKEIQKNNTAIASSKTSDEKKVTLREKNKSLQECKESIKASLLLLKTKKILDDKNANKPINLEDIRHHSDFQVT